MTDADQVRQALAELQEVVRCRCDEAYRDRGLKDPHCECDSAEAVKVVTDRIEALTKERDHWKDVAAREGVCMTCSGPYGAPEPHGCFDCFNTGYCGEHHNTVADLEAKLEKAVEALEYYAVEAMPWDADDSLQARATLAEIKGESHA